MHHLPIQRIESFVAICMVTNERFDFGMCPGMNFQTVRGQEGFVTVWFLALELVFT